MSQEIYKSDYFKSEKPDNLNLLFANSARASLFTKPESRYDAIYVILEYITKQAKPDFTAYSATKQSFDKYIEKFSSHPFIYILFKEKDEVIEHQIGGKNIEDEIRNLVENLKQKAKGLTDEQCQKILEGLLSSSALDAKTVTGDYVAHFVVKPDEKKENFNVIINYIHLEKNKQLYMHTVIFKVDNIMMNTYADELADKIFP